MDMAPIKITTSHVTWTVCTFLTLTFFVLGLIIWQFWGLTPQEWCPAKQLGDAANFVSCVSELLHNKDHITLGLIGILAITIVCLAVVALGLFVRADAPGGIHVDVGEDHGTPPTAVTTTTTTQVNP